MKAFYSGSPPQIGWAQVSSYPARLRTTKIVAGSILLIGSVLAQPSYAQNLDNTIIEVEFRKESLANIFEILEKKTNLFFAYPGEGMEKHRSEVTLAKGKYSVKEILDFVLKGTPIKYYQSGNHIVVYIKKSASEPDPP